MTISIQAAGAKDRGQVREINEDEIFYRIVQATDEEPVGLFVVCDGMGGHAGGEFASRWAVETIRDELKDLFEASDRRKTVKLSEEELEALAAGQPMPTRKLAAAEIEERIRRAIGRANEVVRKIAQARPQEAGDTGTTVTMALVKGEMAYIANVGDSRTYLYRDGQLRPVTRDHSVVASLVQAGIIQPEEVYIHPQRNLIFRSLGAKPEVEVDLFRQELQPGDRLLLCSDGLWEMVRDSQIAKIMEKAPNPKTTCQRLIDAANTNGGEDNISAIVVWAE
jgi:serine/threonine protein phosphatase PrpC